MFGLVWGPTLAAVSVVLDNAADAGVVRRALDCLLLSARMAAYHQVGVRGVLGVGCVCGVGGWVLGVGGGLWDARWTVSAVGALAANHPGSSRGFLFRQPWGLRALVGWVWFWMQGGRRQQCCWASTPTTPKH